MKKQNILEVSDIINELNRLKKIELIASTLIIQLNSGMSPPELERTKKSLENLINKGVEE